MARIPAVYNERSWAIDLIGHIKQITRDENRSIKDASGEQTVRTEGGSLFPDVLLFGDRSTARILQGWELKMPDTGIDDPEFRDNAETKARALGLDSFILWNVSQAHLYTRDDRDHFSVAREWNDLADITTRKSVVASRTRWETLAAEIVAYVNDLFDRGSLEGRQFIEAYRSGGITALIMENSGLVTEALIAAEKRNSALKAAVVLWWDKYQAEYGGGPKSTAEDVLGQAILSNWIGKLLFAHILREKDSRAQAVATITDETTPADALGVFRQLSDDCNFWTIFSDSVGLGIIPERPWDQLKQFNKLLSDLRVGSVDQAQLSGVLEATVEVATRKLRGQYPTPIELSRLLVHLCLRNTVEDRLLDPCCGSGTIARAAIEQKLAAGVSGMDAAASVYAGDQDPQAVQIATFALAKPSMMHVPLRLFQEDAFDLKPTTAIGFRNPSTGAPFSELLGEFDAVTSNLPFVAQEGRKQYGNAIAGVTATFDSDEANLPGRADVAAYLPFSFHPLLKAGGRLGIIITNAWLGTDWGDAFYNSLSRYYELKSVVTSGAGRWFRNSDVVTNILIMEKKADPARANGNVNFIVLTRPLEEMADLEAVGIAAAQIELAQSQNETMTIRSVSPAQLSKFRKLGLGGNAQFVNSDWVLTLPLVPLTSVCTIRRGERRGLNALFYPKSGHGIEPEYIRPLAKSLAAFSKLVGKAEREAFSCSRSEAELRRLGHTGALKWIQRFKTAENVSKLTSAKSRWYEMKADTMSELVMSINYGSRLFVARLDPPAFVDQRLVRLDHKAGVDGELCHALLNSTIGMFIIEGMGFGRGLGALDLNKDRIEKYMHILDPRSLSKAGAKSVKDAFRPLVRRNILGVADELEQTDRQDFDKAVIEAFGLSVDIDIVYDSVRGLVEIRETVTS